ncbi:MAG TPA: response regulator [Thermoanaerobaculia bacterium]|jgi:CheY-like chemotaxis protein|nr:response regulator [Thermoanaerobaculia bacterium]
MSAARILIVEDDSAIRTLIVSALKREPLDVHTAGDGLAALECVRANDYAVILLDLMMPRLNGYEFLESLDSVRGDAQPVIIVMTAFDSGALKKLPANRVHAVLHKPFDVERVVDLVRDCAALHRDERMTRTIQLPLEGSSDEESTVC